MSLVVEELSAPGAGAVTILRVRGPGARARVEALAGRGLEGEGAPLFVRLHADGEALEEALVVEDGPEEVELHLHGSPPLVARIRRLLSRQEPASPDGVTAGGPEPWCFERYALGLLGRTESEAGARLLLDQVQGALRRHLARLVHAAPQRVRPAVEELLRAARLARRALDPPRVVLAGPTNAGKSTLFNALFGADRVLANPAAGTTRDAIEEPVRLGEWLVYLVDTAGERSLVLEGEPAARAVERAGQALAREEGRRADLLLWLDPAGEPGCDPPPPDPLAGSAEGARPAVRPAVPPAVPVVRLVSCADRLGRAERQRLGDRALSAREDPEGARRVVRLALQEALELSPEPWSAGRPVPLGARVLDAVVRLGGAPSTQERARLVARALGPALPLPAPYGSAFRVSR